MKRQLVTAAAELVPFIWLVHWAGCSSGLSSVWMEFKALSLSDSWLRERAFKHLGQRSVSAAAGLGSFSTRDSSRDSPDMERN